MLLSVCCPGVFLVKTNSASITAYLKESADQALKAANRKANQAKRKRKDSIKGTDTLAKQNVTHIAAYVNTCEPHRPFATRCENGSGWASLCAAAEGPRVCRGPVHSSHRQGAHPCGVVWWRVNEPNCHVG